MTVKVKFFAMLAQKLAGAFPDQYPQGLRAGLPVELELPAGCDLSELIDRLPVEPGYVFTVFVNGRARQRNHRLADGDEVGIFPPIAGG